MKSALDYYTLSLPSTVPFDRDLAASKIAAGVLLRFGHVIDEVPFSRKLFSWSYGISSDIHLNRVY
jgi:hypothetical protein